MGILGKKKIKSTYTLGKAEVLDIVGLLITTGSDVRAIYQQTTYEKNWILETRKMVLDTERKGLSLIQENPEITEGDWYSQLYQYAIQSPVLTDEQRVAYQDLTIEEFQGLARYVIMKNPIPNDADFDADRTFEEFKSLNVVQESV